MALTAVLRHGKVRRTQLVVGADGLASLAELSAELSESPEILLATALRSKKAGVCRFEAVEFGGQTYLRAARGHSLVVVGASQPEQASQPITPPSLLADSPGSGGPLSVRFVAAEGAGRAPRTPTGFASSKAEVASTP